MSYKEDIQAKELKKFNEVRDALEVVWSEGYPPHIAVFTGVNGDIDSDLLSPPGISGPDGVTIFNLGVQAIRNFSFDESKFTINFSTKFGGRDTHIIIPVRCIVAVLKDREIVLLPEEVWSSINPHIPTGGVPHISPLTSDGETKSSSSERGSIIKSVVGNVISANFGRK